MTCMLEVIRCCLLTYFRHACMKNYELDPAHFISLPGPAWQACLKMKNIELELLRDYDMLLMIEEGIRGGICHAIQRYAKANNKYINDYNKDKESSYLQYLDANNLYGAAMSKKLSTRGFKWVSDISKLVDNLTEGIHNDKCNKCKSNLCFVRAMNGKLIFECVDCGKEYEKRFNKELLERFANTYEFCGNDLNKFLILLRKGVYPNEYMDGWDKFDEKALPRKGSFCSSLTMEDISETDYLHANNVFKKFDLNNLGEYHDLYVRSDTLLLADVF